jgi:hypothetical protein
MSRFLFIGDAPPLWLFTARCVPSFKIWPATLAEREASHGSSEHG